MYGISVQDTRTSRAAKKTKDRIPFKEKVRKHTYHIQQNGHCNGNFYDLAINHQRFIIELCFDTPSGRIDESTNILQSTTHREVTISIIAPQTGQRGPVATQIEHNSFSQGITFILASLFPQHSHIRVVEMDSN